MLDGCVQRVRSLPKVDRVHYNDVAVFGRATRHPLKRNIRNLPNLPVVYVKGIQSFPLEDGRNRIHELTLAAAYPVKRESRIEVNVCLL